MTRISLYKKKHLKQSKLELEKLGLDNSIVSCYHTTINLIYRCIMIIFNPTLRALEIRIVLSIRKYFRLRLSHALVRLRNLTHESGIETALCYNKIICAKNRKKFISKMFKL